MHSMPKQRVGDLFNCQHSQITQILTWTEEGVLGWKTKVPQSLKRDFEEVAFNLEPSTLKKPIIGELKSDQGYHLIVVTDRR